MTATAAGVVGAGAILGWPILGAAVATLIVGVRLYFGPPAVVVLLAALFGLASSVLQDVKEAGEDLRWVALACLALWPIAEGRGQWLMCRRSVLWFAGGFTLWAACSVSWSATPALSAQRLAACTLLLVVSFVTVPTALPTLASRESLGRYLAWVGIGGTTLALALGVATQEAWLGELLRGWLENSNTMGNWAACLLPTLLLLPARTRLMAALPFAATILLSGSRAALLVLLAVSLSVLPRRHSTKAIVGLGVAVVVAAIMISPLRHTVLSPALEKFTDSDADLVRTLTGARNEAWEASYDLIVIAPMEGLGFGAGDQLFAITGLDRTFTYYQGATSGSAYLTIWVEVGLVGLLLFIATVVAAFRDALAAGPLLQPLAGVALAVFGIGLVESFLTSPGSPFMILGFITLGLAAAPTLRSTNAALPGHPPITPVAVQSRPPTIG